MGALLDRVGLDEMSRTFILHSLTVASLNAFEISDLVNNI